MGGPIIFRDMSEGDNRMLLWVYGAGFVGMMLVLTLLYWNVYRKRTQLGLTPEEAFDARMGARTHLVSVSVGLLSIVMALTVPIQLMAAVPIYVLQGPLHWRNGVLIERARARAFPSSTPARR